MRPAQRMAEREGAFEPLAGPEMPFGGRQLAHRGQHQSHGRVGHFLVEDAGRVGHDESGLPGPGRIDRIIADAEVRHDGQGGEALQKGGIDNDVTADRNGADIGRDTGQGSFAIVRLPELHEIDRAVEALDDQRLHAVRHQNGRTAQNPDSGCRGERRRRRTGPRALIMAEAYRRGNRLHAAKAVDAFR